MRSEARFRYEVAGTTIASDIELPGLPPSVAPAARWRIIRRHHDHPFRGVEYHSWRHAWGETWLRFLREGDDRCLVFPRALDVVVSESSREARCSPHEGVALARVQQLIANQVLPLLVGCDRLVLHASAAAIDGRVHAFVGGTGEGKSTLVASLAARGAVLVTDDALVVDDRESPTRVLPWGGPVRLAADTIGHVLDADPARFTRISDGSEKHAVPIRPASDRSLPLHRVYILEKAAGDRAAVRGASRAIAIRDLMQATFEIAADDSARVAMTFDRVTRVVRDAPVRFLAVPHTYDRLEHVTDVIAADSSAR